MEAPRGIGMGDAIFLSALQYAAQCGASDLHFCAGERPCVRRQGELSEIADFPALGEGQVREMFETIAGAAVQNLFHERGEVDFAWTGNVYGTPLRLRANASRCMGKDLLVCRLLANDIPSLHALGLPPALEQVCRSKDGLFLVTGRSGMGKSTTLAAMIETINVNAAKHIVTIEDPIEYLFVSKKSRIHQREVGTDSLSFLSALAASLRQDINVIVIGELRDRATIEAALTAAETGHFVLATLHTRSAAQSIERIVDVFPPEQQQQIRLQLSLVLCGVLSQQLIPSVNGTRVAACELLLANNAVRNCVRESKTAQIKNIMQTASDTGMITMEQTLAALCRNGLITKETAAQYVGDMKELEGYLC